MKRKITFYCVSVFMIFTQLSCNESKGATEANLNLLDQEFSSIKKKKTDSESSEISTKADSYSYEECAQHLEKLIRQSDFNDDYMNKHPKGYVIVVHEFEAGKVILQLKRIGEKNRYMPDGWFDLDMKTGKLFLHTDDPTKPLEIKFNKKLFEEFRHIQNNCFQYNED